MRPNLIFNQRVFTDLAMTGNLDSGVIDIGEVAGYAVHGIWTGAPVGNIVISGSNDGINFKAVSTSAAGGAAGQVLYDEDFARYVYLKVTYAFTSGTGTLNCYVSAKRN